MSKRFSVIGEQVTSESGQYTFTEETTEMGTAVRVRLTNNNTGQHMMFKVDEFFDMVNCADDFADEIEEEDDE